MKCAPFAVALALAFLASAAPAAEDAYAAYLKQAPEYRSVPQDARMMTARWDNWVYMPWRYQWTIGEGDEGGQFCRDYGFNGGFVDHADGPLAWIEKWNLKFYNDHTAGKGYLYLRGANDRNNFTSYFRDARAPRSGTDGPQPLDDKLLAKLKGIVSERVTKLKGSPMRIAYALDDEVSWGAFVLPIAWRVNEDDTAYEAWLSTYYGGSAPAPQYVTPDYCFSQYDKPISEIDFSPLLDRLCYNDSVWANVVGKLVEHANSVDPETPCGFVGGQSPSIWGGYDYAKLSKKIQFIEAYDLGSSQEVIRSFNPDNAMPVVMTHFHNDKAGVAADSWQSWNCFAHGNRGIIGWVEGWFDGPTPRPWLKEYSPTLKELGGVQGKKLVGAKWIHDGVAIYYSHPSIQVSWCLDIECHGKTWVNRAGDFKLGTSHTVRKAWENILNDAGLQYDFIPYDRVAVSGVPSEYKVLILPAVYALSDAEAAQIQKFAENGGTVIADFACGLFDQHGKGRSSGAIDSLFGVTRNGKETKKDFFGGSLWVEADQDKGYGFNSYRELLDTVKCRMDNGFAVAEPKLPVAVARSVGKGKAVYLNLSPLRYLQYREEGTADAAKREPFVKNVLASGVKPWVKVTSGGKPVRNAEAVYWAKGGRTYLLVVQNVPMTGGEEGGGTASHLVRDRLPVEIEFAAPMKKVLDERTGKALPDGAKFELEFNTVEAVFVSFEGGVPGR